MSSWKHGAARPTAPTTRPGGRPAVSTSIHDQAKAIIALPTLDQRRAAIATFQRRNGSDQGDLLRRAIDIAWSERALEPTA